MTPEEIHALALTAEYGATLVEPTLIGLEGAFIASGGLRMPQDMKPHWAIISRLGYTLRLAEENVGLARPQPPRKLRRAFGKDSARLAIALIDARPFGPDLFSGTSDEWIQARSEILDRRDTTIDAIAGNVVAIGPEVRAEDHTGARRLCEAWFDIGYVTRCGEEAAGLTPRLVARSEPEP